MTRLSAAHRSDELLDLLQQVRQEMSQGDIEVLRRSFSPDSTISKAIDLVIGTADDHAATTEVRPNDLRPFHCPSLFGARTLRAFASRSLDSEENMVADDAMTESDAQGLADAMNSLAAEFPPAPNPDAHLGATEDAQ